MSKVSLKLNDPNPKSNKCLNNFTPAIDPMMYGFLVSSLKYDSAASNAS